MVKSNQAGAEISATSRLGASAANSATAPQSGQPRSARVRALHPPCSGRCTSCMVISFITLAPLD